MYQRVYETLRKRLQGGEWAPGIRLPTLQEMANEFTVSTSTIRSAFNMLEKDGCVYQVPDVGAFVHPSYCPSSPGTVTVALAMIDIGGPFEMQIARGVEHACQERGWDLKIYDARHQAPIEASNLTRLAASGTRGAIVMPIGNNANLEHLVRLKIANFPVVLVDRGIIGLNVDVVESDNKKGAFVAAEHLIQRGLQQIFMVSDPIAPVAETSVLARVQGFEQALKAYGVQLSRGNIVWTDPDVCTKAVREGHRWLAGYEAIIPLLKSTPLPIGVFALNDSAAWGVVQACRKLGLRVPEDVSIVSFDDSDIALALVPSITVVAQRPNLIGRKAVELLERRLQPGGMDLPPEHIHIDVELIQRGSVVGATSELTVSQIA